METRDIYEQLRPPGPTPADEICSCRPGTSVKLMSVGGQTFNPIHCLDCNLEVPPERLGLDVRLVDAVADWIFEYGAIDALELASGEYEAWARGELLDVTSPGNRGGLELTRRLNELMRCYFWLWQPQSDEDWEPPPMCPLCGETFVRYDAGLFPQLLCDRDSIVVVGR